MTPRPETSWVTHAAGVYFAQDEVKVILRPIGSGVHATIDTPTMAVEITDMASHSLRRIATHAVVAMMPEEGLDEAFEVLRDYIQFYQRRGAMRHHLEEPHREVQGIVETKGDRAGLTLAP